MKTLRLFTILMLTILVLSLWTPAPVYAKQFGAASASTRTSPCAPPCAGFCRLSPFLSRSVRP